MPKKNRVSGLRWRFGFKRSGSEEHGFGNPFDTIPFGGEKKEWSAAHAR